MQLRDHADNYIKLEAICTCPLTTYLIPLITTVIVKCHNYGYGAIGVCIGILCRNISCHDASQMTEYVKATFAM